MRPSSWQGPLYSAGLAVLLASACSSSSRTVGRDSDASAGAGGRSGNGGASGNTGSSGTEGSRGDSGASGGRGGAGGSGGTGAGGTGGSGGSGGSGDADGSVSTGGNNGASGAAGTGGTAPTPCQGLGPTEQCRECCRTEALVTFGDFRDAFYPCACAAETCYASCGGASDTCNVTTIAPSLACFQCMAGKASSMQCREAFTTCDADPACRGYAACVFQGCLGLVR